MALDRANESIRKGVRYALLFWPIVGAVIIIGVVYDNRPMVLALPYAAAIVGLMFDARNFSQLRLTEAGIEFPPNALRWARVVWNKHGSQFRHWPARGPYLMPWSAIVRVAPGLDAGRAKWCRVLHLESGEVLTLSFLYAWSLSDIDSVFNKYVRQAAG
jgi:hypothetical protein